LAPFFQAAAGLEKLSQLLDPQEEETNH